LIKQAVEGCEQYPCLWLRGLLPEDLSAIPDENCPSNSANIQYVNHNLAVWGSGTYYGDASGGVYTEYGPIRRVGVGVAIISASGDLLYGLHTNLPGKIQTVSKGELYALYLVVDHVHSDSVIIFVTDNYGVFEIFNKGASAAVNSANCELYGDVFSLIRGKNLAVTVRWMPSHLDEDDAPQPPEDVTELDIVGNGQADKLAGKAAELHKLPNSVAVPYMIIAKRIRNVQKRLATILLYLPERRSLREVKEKQPRKPVPDHIQLLDTTSHSITLSDSRYSCSVCLCNFHHKDPSCKQWLQSICVNPMSGVGRSNKPIPLNDVVHIGNQVSHISHKLYRYKDSIYCNKCGCCAGPRRLVLLAHPCSPPSIAGARFLHSIAMSSH